MSEETFTRARAFARDITENNRRTNVSVVAIHLIVNGYDLGDRQCKEVNNHAVEYDNHSGVPALTVWPDREWKGAESAFYIVDDGKSARPLFVAGYRTDQSPGGRFRDDYPEQVHLHAFPLDYGPDGERRLRTDTGRPVDYSRYMLSSRRAYHVKMRRNIPALGGEPF